MWVTYLVFLGYTPYILNSKVVRESFCVTSNSKWFNILRVWRCRSFFYLSGSSWDRRTWCSGGFIFWNSRGPRMFERRRLDLLLHQDIELFVLSSLLFILWVELGGIPWSWKINFIPHDFLRDDEVRFTNQVWLEENDLSLRIGA